MVKTGGRAQALLDGAEVVWWAEGDLGLTVRRVVAAGSGVGGRLLSSQTVYTYFGSMDAVIIAMAERAVADLRQLTEDPLNPGLWREYAQDFPARWYMAATGRTPHGVPLPDLVVVIDRCRDMLGGPVGFAMLNGVVGAELHGQLGADDVSPLVAT